jgi:PTH2 family peptidyl-tRNA hydrolase
MYKQAIIIRTDIKMSTGKKCVQCCHASLGAYRNANKGIIDKWESQGEKKVVLKVKSKEELLEIFERAKKERIPCFLVKDAGLTELKPGTITALGIGPEEEEKLDKITGKLKLL